MVDSSSPFQLYTQAGQEWCFPDHVTFTICLKNLIGHSFSEEVAFFFLFLLLSFIFLLLYFLHSVKMHKMGAVDGFPLEMCVCGGGGC